MAKPHYNPGHILTATEINDTLVNDDGSELEAYLTQMRQEITEKVIELPNRYQELTIRISNLEAKLPNLNKYQGIYQGA